MNTKNRVLLCNFMLVLAAAIWGANFVVQKIVTTDIGPFLFMSVRSFLGSLTMALIITVLEKREPQMRTVYTRASALRLARIAVLCGIVNVTGSVLVQWGLFYTTASKAGFLNAIYIIFVPIIGLVFFKKKSNRFMWLGIVLACVGLYFLCLDGEFSINPGDLIVLSSTLFFSTHIHLISKFVQQVNGMHLVCLEFFFASVYCLICSLIVEAPHISQVITCSYSILFAGVLGIGVCYLLQVTAQKYTDPTIAALLMSLESVFGAIGGIVFLRESFQFKEVIGIIFIIIAIVVAQLSSSPNKESDAKPVTTQN